MLTPPWSRDWRDQTVVVAASGQSQCKEDLDYVRGRCRVVVINSTWRLAPWADILYFCDANWWYADGPKQHEFPGQWVIGKAQGGELSGAFPANVVPQDMMIWDGERIGGGGGSGFQVLNLLAVWGVARVIYLGLDCTWSKQVHWHGPHKNGRPNPKEGTIARWRLAFERNAPDVARRGVEVFNASRQTSLACFPRVNLREII